MRNFKVWQTYKGSAPLYVKTDTPHHAAEVYAEENNLTKKANVVFVAKHDDKTWKYTDPEAATIYVTEI